MRMQGYCDVFKGTILKRTLPEVKCLHPTSSRHEMCKSSVSGVMYHKFSHSTVSYTLNGENVNVMLELEIKKCNVLYPDGVISVIIDFVNPFALRTAKTQWSFCCSECNRVKISPVLFKQFMSFPWILA